jgi:two-component system response regulator NreC
MAEPGCGAYGWPMAVNLHLAPTPGTAPVHRCAGDPIRVVLAEDHALMRRNLRSLLDREAGVEVVAEAQDLAGVVRRVRGLRPDILILDLGMPDGSSVEAVRRLRAETPSTQIVVLTMQDNPAFVNQALDAGAIGFVLKDLADTELPDAIRETSAGRQYVSPTAGARLGPSTPC